MFKNGHIRAIQVAWGFELKGRNEGCINRNGNRIIIEPARKNGRPAQNYPVPRKVYDGAPRLTQSREVMLIANIQRHFSKVPV